MQLTKTELKDIRNFLTNTYAGISEQDNLWNLISKINNLIEGDIHGRIFERDKSTAS